MGAQTSRLERQLEESIVSSAGINDQIRQSLKDVQQAMRSEDDTLKSWTLDNLKHTVIEQNKDLVNAIDIIKEIEMNVSAEKKIEYTVPDPDEEGKRIPLKDARVKYAWLLTAGMLDLGMILSPTSEQCSFITPSCSSLLGYSSEEIVESQLNYQSLVHPEDRDMFSAFVKSVSVESESIETTAPIIRFLKKPISGSDLGTTFDSIIPFQMRASRLKFSNLNVDNPIQVAVIAREYDNGSPQLMENDTNAHTAAPTATSFEYKEDFDEKKITAATTRPPSIFLSKIYTNANTKVKGEVEESVQEESMNMPSSLDRRTERGHIFSDSTGLRVHMRSASTQINYKKSQVIDLPRGGTQVKTSAGPVQIGMPPETIKDSMAIGLDIPNFFIVPKVLFNREAGINVGEFEFPAYFNFFIKRKNLSLVTTPKIAERIKIIFQETLLGPRSFDDLDQEFIGEKSIYRKPNLRKECDFFSKNPFEPGHVMTVDTLLEFTFFDEHGVAILPSESDVEVKIVDEGDEYVILENNLEMFRCSVDIPVPDFEVSWNAKPSTRVLQSTFKPPGFGVTFLGCSDGFDPCGTTTGFVLWINGRGFVVDPPTHSSAILRLYGISRSLIDGVIVTHCHADHDAGTFHKILEEERVTVVTTSTVMNSFMRKYSAITNIDLPTLKTLFDFRCARIGEPMNIHGAEVNFFYTLHSIPCIGFECFYGGKSLYYSGDTLYDPSKIQKLFEEGVVSEGRKESLLEIPTRSVIIHEAGVPPIHTPLENLQSLSQEKKDRLYVVHCAAKKVTPDIGLRRGEEGIEGSINIPIQDPELHKAMRILDLLSSVEFFREFPMDKVSELLEISTFVHYSANTIIQNNKTFSLVAEGFVELKKHGNESNFLTVGDFFGYKSILTEEDNYRPPFEAVALSSCTCIEFKRFELRRLLERTPSVLQRMNRMKETRGLLIGDALSYNSVFRKITHNQMVVLRQYMHPKVFKSGDVVMKSGDHADFGAFIRSGKVAVEISRTSNHQDEKETFERELRQGAFVGDINALINKDESEGKLTMTVSMTEDGELFLIYKKDLDYLCHRYPGILVSLYGSMFKE